MDQSSESITCKECKKISKCFRKLLPAELEFVDHYKVQITYSMGEDICKQGAFASSIIYILNGLIKLSIEGPNNKNFIVRIIKPTEFIGLSAQQSYMFSILVGVRAMDFENFHKNELYDYVWRTVNDTNGFKKTLAEHKKDKENVFVPDYDEVQKIVNNYIKEGDDLDFKIILKIYATYPFRLEVAELKFLKTLHEYKKEMNKDLKGNYIVKKSRPRNSFMFSFNNYKTFEKYGERKINVTDKVLTKLLLDKILTDQPWADNKLTRNSMSKKITAFFEKNGLKGVHPTNLSKMVIKKEYEKMGKELRDTQIRLAAERGHSVNTQLEIYLTD